MQIRCAEVKDEPAVSEMFYELYPNFKAVKETVSVNSASAKCFTLVSEDNDGVTGFLIGTFITYGPCKYGYIEELYVKGPYRRRGG
jgi:hypothetical protein